MKSISITIALLSGITASTQQVPKTVIVEHFTNTYCSICANKNPAFYTNLDKHPDILHVAYHPSVPYEQCPFNQHNKTENDERTKFYDIFSGTPRLVIQGEVISTSQDYSSASLFTPYTKQTSSFSMTSVLEQNDTKDSIVQTLTITKEDTSTLSQLNLYSSIVEETINFSAQNGEEVHHDVFRKSFIGINPIAISLPTNVGESITYRYTIKYNTEWQINELKALAILQHDDKTVEQGAESNKLSGFVLDIATFAADKITVLPTLFEDKLFVVGNDTTSSFQLNLFDLSGKLMLSQTFRQRDELELSHLNTGIYIVDITNKNSGDKTQVKVIKM